MPEDMSKGAPDAELAGVGGDLGRQRTIGSMTVNTVRPGTLSNSMMPP